MANSEKGALAGPETAAEHVRNAEQILDLLRNDLADLNIYKDAAAERGLEIVSQMDAARARLARALAALEESQSMKRETIGSTRNPAVVKSARHRNNGRYNGDGREWETPPEIFGPLEQEFHFTLDPCATAANAKCSRFFTEEENGLLRGWGRERVFLNPPYGREVGAWTGKARVAAALGALVVALLPASTDLVWWHRDVVDLAEVRYLRGRVRFLTGGPYRASGFFPSVIVIWRPGGEA